MWKFTFFPFKNLLILIYSYSKREDTIDLPLWPSSRHLLHFSGCGQSLVSCPSYEKYEIKHDKNHIHEGYLTAIVAFSWLWAFVLLVAFLSTSSTNLWIRTVGSYVSFLGKENVTICRSVSKLSLWRTSLQFLHLLSPPPPPPPWGQSRAKCPSSPHFRHPLLPPPPPPPAPTEGKYFECE